MAHVGGVLLVRGKLVVALVALGACAALPAAAASAAEWEPAQEISEAATFTSGADLGVDEAGDATVVWTADFNAGAIKSAYLPAGGTWQSVQTPISTTSCATPTLAVASTGAAVVVADCGNGKLKAAFRSTATGSWGSVVEVPGSENSAAPDAAIDGAGNAVVIWDRAETIESSYRPASSGTWSTTAEKISVAGGAGPFPAAHVAMAPNGFAIAVWSDKEGSASYVITSKSRPPGAASLWGSLATYPFFGGEALAPQIAVNASNSVVVWQQRATSTEPSVLASYWGKNGTQHEATETAGQTAEEPSVAIDAQGRAIAVWRGFNILPGEGVMQTSTAAADGSWSTPATVPTPGADYLPGFAFPPQVAMDDAGDANAVWSTHSGTLYAASGSAEGSFGAAVPISNANGAYPETKTPTPLVMDHTGTAFAAWTAESGGRLTVAMRDGAPPTLSGIVVPLSGDTGASVSMSASASDVWSPPTTLHWDFGDGASGTGNSVTHSYSAPGTYTVKVSASDAQGNLSAAQERQIVVTGSGGETKRPQVQLRASVARQSWKAIAAARAIKVKCGLDVSGTCAAVATVSGSTAKKLGLIKVGNRLQSVGSGSAAIAAQQIGVVKVKLTKRARTAIAAAKQSATVAIAVTGSAPGQRDATVTKKLKIKRP